MREDKTLSNANPDQAKYWNSSAGDKWVRFQVGLDALMETVSARLLEKAAIEAGENVLDIGCGTGATTLAIASEIGANGSVVGADISKTLLDFAKTRSPEKQSGDIEYLLADAQSHAFVAGKYDLLISRFGVMFFSDPVKAFANMTSALRPGGRVLFVSWSSASDNPWFAVPGDAAIEQLGKPAPAEPTAPGPLAFQDVAYVVSILQQAGLNSCAGVTENLDLFYSGGIGEAASLASNVGPAVRIVKEFNGDEKDVKEIERKTIEGFREYVCDQGVRIPASLNFYEAFKP